MTVTATKHHTILKNPDESKGRGRELKLTFHVYSVYGAAVFTLPDQSKAVHAMAWLEINKERKKEEKRRIGKRRQKEAKK